MSEDLDPLRRLRPDGSDPVDPGDPAAVYHEKEQLMSTIDADHETDTAISTPDVYPRLAYRDEHAAIDYLTRVFGFVEDRAARMEFGEQCLAWLRMGTGLVMVGRTNADVHLIHSPRDVGLTTVMMNVYVHDIDQHYARAVEQGATVTMELEDAFYGERRYEATDPEGHRWHFGERFADIRARGGRDPEPGPAPDGT